MTDRLRGVWVAFEQDIREDDAESLISAIKHLRGVLAVESKVSNSTDWMAEERARGELRKKLIAVLWPEETRT
jgi:hypothetical protein